MVVSVDCSKVIFPHTGVLNAGSQGHPKAEFKRPLIRFTLGKHAYLNIQKILQPKNENFQRKNSDIFHISAQNIDCGYLLELPQ